MRVRLFVVLALLFGLAGCGRTDFGAEGNRIVTDPKLFALREGFAGESEPALAAIEGLPWAERGPTESEDSCKLNDLSGLLSTEYAAHCRWITSRYYGADVHPDTQKQVIRERLAAAGWTAHEWGPNSPGFDYDHYQRQTGDQLWSLNVYRGERDRRPQWLSDTKVEHLEEFAYRKAAEIDYEETFRDLTSRRPFVLRFTVFTTYLDRVY